MIILLALSFDLVQLRVTVPSHVSRYCVGLVLLPNIVVGATLTAMVLLRLIHSYHLPCRALTPLSSYTFGDWLHSIIKQMELPHNYLFLLLLLLQVLWLIRFLSRINIKLIRC